MSAKLYQRWSAFFALLTIIGTTAAGFGIHWIMGAIVLSIWCFGMAYACNLCAKEEKEK